jgi:hypothetical protein
MDFIVQRKMTANKYIYEVLGDNTYCGESNYTFNIGLRNITIFSNGEPVYVLKQTNWWIKMITYFPLFWLAPIGQFPKYKFFDKGAFKGETKCSFFTPKRIIVVENRNYEIYLHSNNYISILKNDVQIALIKKSDWTKGEQNRYAITFDEHLESDMALLFLFTIFVDNIFYPNRFRVNYVKYEKTIGHDKLYHRTTWKSPQGDI